MVATVLPTHLDDRFRPEPVLDGAGDLLAAALRGAGGTPVRWTPVQVTYRPPRSVNVSWDVQVRWGDRSPTSERVVAHVGRRVPSGPGVALLEGDDGVRAAIWIAPHDPVLVGMAAAMDPVRLSRLLVDVGLLTVLPDPATIRTQVRAYRPRRRAVVEITTPGARLFAKVVPPGEAERLHECHRVLVDRVPVPNSLGWTDDGIVVLEAAPGRTLRDVLLGPSGRGAAPVPPFASVSALLDRLPAELAERPGAPAPLDRVADHVGLLAAVVPDQAGRLATLADTLAEPLGADPDGGPVVAHHGDLYEAQLLVDGGHVTGLLDVDGAGAGHRIDDHATLLAHLSVLGRSLRHRRTEALGARWIREIDGGGDPAELRRRVAAVVLGLATGPFRVQEANWQAATRRRIDLAESWLASARRAAGSIAAVAPESNLTTTSR